jgi:hypothetical protein
MAIGGSAGEIHTKVRASRRAEAVHASEDGGIVATGPGAMSIGGDVSKVWTDVSEADGQSEP